MDTFEGEIPKSKLKLFFSDIGSSEYFSYVGNMVSVEKSLGVMAILSPDFLLREDHILWTSDSGEYNETKYPLSNKVYKTRKERERYRNNFPVSQFFLKWEDDPRVDGRGFKVGLVEEEHQLCHIFAKELSKHWHRRLKELFPDREFEFEVADDILDEYGVCMTFSQK